MAKLGGSSHLCCVSYRTACLSRNARNAVTVKKNKEKMLLIVGSFKKNDYLCNRKREKDWFWMSGLSQRSAKPCTAVRIRYNSIRGCVKTLAQPHLYFKFCYIFFWLCYSIILFPHAFGNKLLYSFNYACRLYY